MTPLRVRSTTSLPALAAVSLSLLVSTGRPATPPPAIELRPGPHLFVDDYLIASQANLSRAVQHPIRARPPLVGERDDNSQPYVTVLRDPQSGRFRLWYNVRRPEYERPRIGYLESHDGVHWRRPHRVLDTGGPEGYGASVIDEGRAFGDRRNRFKLAWWGGHPADPGGDVLGGIWIAGSPDGIRWRPLAPRPLIVPASDIVSLFRDRTRKRYVALVKLVATPTADPEGRRSIEPRRIVGQSTSADARAWTPARPVVVPDERDSGVTQFYGLGGVIQRGGLLLGFLRVLRDDLPADPGGPVRGIGYTVLAWSRDGKTWSRDREPFLDRGRSAASWDHAMAWADAQLRVGDEMFIYYGGYDTGHKVGKRRLGLARLPVDRYVARVAGRRPGRLVSPPVRLGGRALTVNADVDGRLVLRFLDQHGRPLRGYGSCHVPARDGLALPVRCDAPVSALRGRTVRIELSLVRARLFGLGVGR